MTRRDWDRGDGHAVGLFLNGDALLDRDAQGRRIVDDSFLLLVNAHHEDVPFVLPARRFGMRWDVELTTVDPAVAPGSLSWGPRSTVDVTARSIAILKRSTDA
jgi:glycogen operon protein